MHHEGRTVKSTPLLETPRIRFTSQHLQTDGTEAMCRFKPDELKTTNNVNILHYLQKQSVGVASIHMSVIQASCFAAAAVQSHVLYWI